MCILIAAVLLWFYSCNLKAVINIFILTTADYMYMEGVTLSVKPTENYHLTHTALFSSTERCSVLNST